MEEMTHLKFGGYNLALNNISWRTGNRLIIHIADAGAHGTEYTSGDKYPLEGPKLDNYIKKCAEQKITIVAFKIGQNQKNHFQGPKIYISVLAIKIIKFKNLIKTKKIQGISLIL